MKVQIDFELIEKSWKACQGGAELKYDWLSEWVCDRARSREASAYKKGSANFQVETVICPIITICFDFKICF